uniref:Uncharacterized protein n=1 Tax=Anas platyrhynchos platyrhynchos TaxID=8840 RepID=U3I104_ANAPP
MEDTSVSGLDNSKLEAIAHEIYTELVEDACLGLCFEAYHCTKCSNFYLDDKTHAAQDTQTSWLCSGGSVPVPYAFRAPWAAPLGLPHGTQAVPHCTQPLLAFLCPSISKADNDE